MKVTVCELQDSLEGFRRDWERLVEHVQAQASDLVLLPEMPFYPWPFTVRQFDPLVWSASEAAHQEWLHRLPGLAPAAVLATRPVSFGSRRMNEGFAWDAISGYRAVHHKYYLPDDEGFWEASWYRRGEGAFLPAQVAGAGVGFVICSELWFMQRARAYGQQGVHILAAPRCTERATLDKWLAGGRAAAVIAGAYCLSSNHVNPPQSRAALGGQGWIIDPDGQVLGLTSTEQPFLTLEIDPYRAVAARRTYPRYIED